LLAGTEKVVFGEQGGLVEIKYAAAGFLHVRREAYDAIRERLAMPMCNQRFGRGIWPFFLPLPVEEDASTQGAVGRPAPNVCHRYLTDDFAFSHRAREAGLTIMADTSIRLWRMGTYGYGWEDAGSETERFETYQFRVQP
jgi:hypothetical protein